MNARAYLGGLMLLAGCSTPPETPLPRRPEVMLEHVQMRSFKGQQLMAVGWADRMSYARASSDVEGTNARVRLPRRFGPGPRAPGDIGGVEIRAPNVEGNLATQQIEGRGGVAMRTASGVTGATEKARYDGQTMTASGEEPVQLRGPHYDLEAHGFVFQMQDDAFEFGGPVHSQISGRPQ